MIFFPDVLRYFIPRRRMDVKGKCPLCQGKAEMSFEKFPQFFCHSGGSRNPVKQSYDIDLANSDLHPQSIQVSTFASIL